MMRRMTALVVALAVALAVMTAPRPAAADDDLVYIIPAAVGGVVAVIVIVAIVMADRSEPEFELAASGRPEPSRPGARLAPDCPPTANGLPLVCW